MNKEYRIVATSKSLAVTETMLNDLASEGWEVTGVTDHQIVLERTKHVETAEKVLLQD